jgi:hypothetical protein
MLNFIKYWVELFFTFIKITKMNTINFSLKYIAKFALCFFFLLGASKALSNPIHPDTLNTVLQMAFERNYITGDSTHPLRVIGERGMTDPYIEKNTEGIINKSEADLKKAAMALVTAIPSTIAADFKVYDYTAYSLIGRMKDPEKWNEWAFGAMDSLIRTKYNVQYYLLIAKEIDPSNGKVKFRVKLRLPTVASGNKSSGNRGGTAQLTKKTLGIIEAFAQKKITIFMASKFLDEADNGSKIGIKEVERGLRLAFDGGFIGDGIYYNPAGYPVAIHDVYGFVPTDDILTLKRSGNVVWGWYSDYCEDGNYSGTEAYKALIDKEDNFKGYYKYTVGKDNSFPSFEDMYNDYPKTIPTGEAIYKLELSSSGMVKKIPTKYLAESNVPDRKMYFEGKYPIKSILKKSSSGYQEDETTGITEKQVSRTLDDIKKEFDSSIETNFLWYLNILDNQNEDAKIAFYQFIYGLRHAHKIISNNKYYMDKAAFSIQTSCSKGISKWSKSDFQNAIVDFDSKIIAFLTIKQIIKDAQYQPSVNDLTIFEELKKLNLCSNDKNNEIWQWTYNSNTYLALKLIYESFSVQERLGLIWYYSSLNQGGDNYGTIRIQLTNLIIFTPEEQYEDLISSLEDYHITNILQVIWKGLNNTGNSMLFSIAKKIQLMSSKFNVTKTKVVPEFVSFEFNPTENFYKMKFRNEPNFHTLKLQLHGKDVFEVSAMAFVKLKPTLSFKWQGENYEGGKEIIIPVCQLLLMIESRNTELTLSIAGDVANSISLAYGIGEAKAIYDLYRLTGKVSKIKVSIVGGALLADGSRIICNVIGEKELLEKYPDYYEKYKKVLFYLDMFNIARNVAGINAISDLKQAQTALRAERDALLTKGAIQTEKTTADAIDAKFGNSINAIINATETNVRINLAARGLAQDVIDDIIVRALYIDDELAKKGSSLNLMETLSELTKYKGFKNPEDIFSSSTSTNSWLTEGVVSINGSVQTEKAAELLNEINTGLKELRLSKGLDEVIISRKISNNGNSYAYVQNTNSSNELDVLNLTKMKIIECKRASGNSATTTAERLKDIVKKFTEEGKLSLKNKEVYPNHYGQLLIAGEGNPLYRMEKEDFISYMKNNHYENPQFNTISKDKLINSMKELEVSNGTGSFIIKSTEW